MLDHYRYGQVTAVAKYVSFWFPAIPNWISALFCVLILMLFNLLSAKLFGELEFWFAIIKIITIIALIVVGLVMILMAYKTQFGHASFTNLYKHGIFTHGASGFFMSFQMALFSFVGIEMIGVTAGETKDPQKTIPKAINAASLRILVFYVGALAVIMSIIPWDKVDPSESPFVRLFSLIGIPFRRRIDQLCSINCRKDHLVIVVYSQIVVCYLVYQNKIKHHLSLEVLIKMVFLILLLLVHLHYY